MRAALIHAATGAVVNIIVADAKTDEPPEGFALLSVPDGMTINGATVWTVDGPVNPEPEPGLPDPNPGEAT